MTWLVMFYVTLWSGSILILAVEFWILSRWDLIVGKLKSCQLALKRLVKKLQ